MEKVSIDASQVKSVLVAIVESTTGDLRELTSSVEALRGKGVGGTRVDRPIRCCRGITGGVEGGTIEKKAFIFAIPWVRLDREGVRSVWGSFMMTMNLGNVRFVHWSYKTKIGSIIEMVIRVCTILHRPLYNSSHRKRSHARRVSVSQLAILKRDRRRNESNIYRKS